MLKVKDILAEKGKDVWSVSSRETAYYALELMAEKDIGALMVIDEGKFVGIFSERDYARKVILHGKSSRETPVALDRYCDSRRYCQGDYQSAKASDQ